MGYLSNLLILSLYLINFGNCNYLFSMFISKIIIKWHITSVKIETKSYCDTPKQYTRSYNRDGVKERENVYMIIAIMFAHDSLISTSPLSNGKTVIV